MAVAVKVGLWGASIGQQHHDISRASKPQSLVSMTFCSSNAFGGAILGFSFEYLDQNNAIIAVGPWGTMDPEQIITEIKMAGGEFLYELSGIASDAILFWLKLVTNRDEYNVGAPPGPTPTFSVPLVNGKVVAFFGRSDNKYLKALGIYVAPVQDWPVKIGPWGGSGGIPVDITTPVQLKSVTVYSTESGDGRVYGFSFTYIDENGDLIPVGPWGRINGQENTFELDQGEFVNNTSGTFDDHGVTSLKFTTNQGVVYGPFGCERGTTFSVPLPDDHDDNGAVVGFFGRSGRDNLVAIGVYVRPAPKP